MQSVTIHWPSAAPGKARPRATIGRGGFARVYTPDATRNAEGRLEIWARDAMAGRPLIEGAVRLSVDATYAMPRSWSGRKRAAMNGKPKLTKPDLDNVVKLIADSLNGVVYVDDAQITCYGGGGKVWGDRDGTVIVVEQIAEAVK